MSWLFSQALVVDYLRQNSLGGAQSAPLSTQHIPQAYCAPDKMTDFSHLSQSGMMFQPLTEERGTELLTSYLEGFRVRRFQQQPEEPTSHLRIFGHKCEELFKKSDLDSYLLKTSQKTQLRWHPVIYWQTGTTQNISSSVHQTWVQIIFGTGFGYLHTPTCTANFAARSMQKHKGCRNFTTVFGKPSPINFEFLMGWPIGWTELKPLETDKYLLWQQSHFSNCGRE